MFGRVLKTPLHCNDAGKLYSTSLLRKFQMKVTLNVSGVIHLPLEWKTTVWKIKRNPRENVQTRSFLKCTVHFYLIFLKIFFIVLTG